MKENPENFTPKPKPKPKTQGFQNFEKVSKPLPKESLDFSKKPISEENEQVEEKKFSPFLIWVSIILMYTFIKSLTK
jgi:hypothetical protein